MATAAATTLAAASQPNDPLVTRSSCASSRSSSARRATQPPAGSERCRNHAACSDEAPARSRNRPRIAVVHAPRVGHGAYALRRCIRPPRQEPHHRCHGSTRRARRPRRRGDRCTSRRRRDRCSTRTPHAGHSTHARRAARRQPVRSREHHGRDGRRASSRHARSRRMPGRFRHRYHRPARRALAGGAPVRRRASPASLVEATHASPLRADRFGVAAAAARKPAASRRGQHDRRRGPAQAVRPSSRPYRSSRRWHCCRSSTP